MSSESTIVFYGARFEVSGDDLPALEARTHEKIVAARRNGLKHYWGNFAAPNEKYLLFVGDRLGILGFENDRAIQVRPDDVVRRMKETDEKLRRAGIFEPPALYCEWQPDA